MMKEPLPQSEDAVSETKPERREKKRLRRRAKMQQHGKGLARVYRDAVQKRASGSTKP